MTPPLATCKIKIFEFCSVAEHVGLNNPEYSPRGYKTISMLNSADHEIYTAHKCQNANNCWHCNIY